MQSFPTTLFKYFNRLPVFSFTIALAVLAILADRLVPASALTEPARSEAASSAGEATDGYPRTVIDGSGLKVRIARPVQRVASGDWAIDEFVYSLMPPEQVVGVSDNAYVERVSNVYKWTQQFHPVVANDPERVIRALPDLLLISSEGPADFTNLTSAAGVATYRMASSFTSLGEIEEAITLTGYLLGQPAAAAAERARFRQAIESARAKRPAHMPSPRILGLSSNFTYGSGTVFDDIVRSIGAVNVGAEAGLKGYDSVSGEQIVRWNPDWIITGADPGKARETAERLLNNPSVAATEAARKGHIAVLDFSIFLSLSPYTRHLVTAIAEAVYGG